MTRLFWASHIRNGSFSSNMLTKNTDKKCHNSFKIIFIKVFNDDHNVSDNVVSMALNVTSDIIALLRCIIELRFSLF